jgi:hypothetical protein
MNLAGNTCNDDDDDVIRAMADDAMQKGSTKFRADMHVQYLADTSVPSGYKDKA